METWSDIAKQQPLAARVMMNSIRKGRISHAYLIQGGRGTGKEAIAKMMAKVLFCEHLADGEPCQTCNACRRINSRNHPDVHWIEPDGQSIKLEQIRNLQKEFTYSGLESDQKAYIIKGAETLTLNAANRILKFLEEPSQKTMAIMLTENGQAMIPTIRSRCQLIELKPLDAAELQHRLVEAGISENSARLLSVLTNDLDEAAALNEDAAFAQARKLVLQWIENLSSANGDGYLFVHQQWLPHFKDRDAQELGLDLLLLAFKDILYDQIGNQTRMVMFQPGDERLEKAALMFTEDKLLHNMNAVLQAKRLLKQNVQPTLVIEQLSLQVKR